MEKIGIRKFIENYNNRATEVLKDEYFNECLEIKKYIPFNLKKTLAKNIVEVSTFEQVIKTNENGEAIHVGINNIHVKSAIHYLLFWRVIVEQYTNLEVETPGFFEEYDLLNETGVLDKIMAMIPEKEIGELRLIVDMEQRDAIAYYGTTEKYVQNQVERFGALISATLSPFLEKFADQLKDLDAEHIDKLAKIIATGSKFKIFN